MTPADPLTPEEVERLDPETRRYYSGANSRDESMWPTVLIVNRVWLRDHIVRAARMAAATTKPVAKPLSEWHEDDGPVVWWKFPVEEPSWIGTPLDSHWPGYHTHWTAHPSLHTIPAPPVNRCEKCTGRLTHDFDPDQGHYYQCDDCGTCYGITAVTPEKEHLE